MKKYIIGFVGGCIIVFVIMVMVLRPIFWENARLINANSELRTQKVKIQYKLDKANKYIKTVTYNFTYYRVRTDKELEDLGKWEAR